MEIRLSVGVSADQKDFKPSSVMDKSSFQDRTRNNYQSQRPDTAKEEKMRATYRKVGRTKEIMESKTRRGRQQRSNFQMSQG